MKQHGHAADCTCSNCEYFWLFGSPDFSCDDSGGRAEGSSYGDGAFKQGSAFRTYTDDVDKAQRAKPVNDPFDKLTTKLPGGAELVLARRVDPTAPKFKPKPTEVFPREPNLLELEARITRLEKWTALPDAQQRSSSCDGPL